MLLMNLGNKKGKRGRNGPQGSKKDNFDLDIKYYALVDFQAFKQPLIPSSLTE